MTYGECKNRALQLAFNYSLAGTEIPGTYNNQADYIALINHCFLHLRPSGEAEDANDRPAPDIRQELEKQSGHS